MASLLQCIVTLLALLAAPTVTLNRAAAVTATAEVDNPGEWKGCGGKLESQRLSSCRQYLRDSSRFSPERGHGGWREEFPRCCDELQRISEQCRCQAVLKVAGEQEAGGELQGEEKRELMLTAQSLPGLCRISPQYCHIESALTF